MTIAKALLLSVLLIGGAFGIFVGHREVGGSNEDLEDVGLRLESDDDGGSGEERSGHHHHHHHKAHSFQHFDGPMSGHHQDVGLRRESDDDGGSGEERSGHHHHHHHHKAHSFQHFHGPVSGHHQEVTWKDKHGHHHHDYKAHPEYKFHYGVEDHHTKDFHGQKEHRDGKELSGEYHIHEPGGNVRTVKYFSDHHGGFFAEVHNHGGNDHSGGTYGKH